MEFKPMKLVYPAHSKHFFYFRQHISKFLLERNCVPLNPFMIFEYFMLDTVDRDTIRNANNNIVRKADEIWVFGPIADGVLEEIRLAKKEGKPVRYFKIIKSKQILEISKEKVEFEDDLEKFRREL
ncbi:MAG: hypothetical protein NUV97_02335 [archaeon]|nr:hypothetical protein [archaeon]MCR4323785.1 hypothetical protein [Nanoarchaeota archaeon]